MGIILISKLVMLLKFVNLDITGWIFRKVFKTTFYQPPKNWQHSKAAIFWCDIYHNARSCIFFPVEKGSFLLLSLLSDNAFLFSLCTKLAYNKCRFILVMMQSFLICYFLSCQLLGLKSCHDRNVTHRDIKPGKGVSVVHCILNITCPTAQPVL